MACSRPCAVSMAQPRLLGRDHGAVGRDRISSELSRFWSCNGACLRVGPNWLVVSSIYHVYIYIYLFVVIIIINMLSAPIPKKHDDAQIAHTSFSERTMNVPQIFAFFYHVLPGT